MTTSLDLTKTPTTTASRPPLTIAIATSEAVPFSKTGGLADVSSALARALAARGHSVHLFVPMYQPAKLRELEGIEFQRKEPFRVQIGDKSVVGTACLCNLPDTSLKVWLINQPEYYDRAELYQNRGEDYPDNSERFIFFSRAVLKVLKKVRIQPDVVHSNDWQTGLIPALIEIEGRGSNTSVARASTIFTLHNMAFQGTFWHWDMPLTGLDWKYFNWEQMEQYGHINLLKTGIVFSDRITTVSPTYADEIQTSEFGCGLDGVLRNRRSVLSGILNGIDAEIWNPKTDPFLVANYDAASFEDGKPVCKSAIQSRLNLPVRRRVPLIGMVSRMTGQKGFDLIGEIASRLLKHDVQLAFLGTGDQRYSELLRNLAEEYPDRVSVTVGFDEGLAHEIEAGSDIYLMPSRYEPCGLNQMYSLAYGTVPVVRATGGLADSVVDATPENIANKTANGFCFTEYSDEALLLALARAVAAFEDKSLWRQLVHTGMQTDWSWNRSATEYEAVYRAAMSSRSSAVPR